MAVTKIGWVTLFIRIALASVGAYGLCYAWIAALVLLLPRLTPLDGVDAAIVSTCGAFILFAAIIVRAFAIRRVARLAVEMAGACVVALVIIGIMLQ